MMEISSVHREVVMKFNTVRRIVAWFGQAREKKPANATAQIASTGSVFDFDPMWHGDHWQNLLSSPMDARHYVMEDWSVATDTEFEPNGLAAHGR
jgi:hypothetical protein